MAKANTARRATYDQQNCNPFIDPDDTDNTAASICNGLALLEYIAFQEATTDKNGDIDSGAMGQVRLLQSLQQAVYYMARMPVSAIDGPLQEVEQ